MDFKETLNAYLDELGCSATELSMQSGVPLSTISRYRSGEHTPSPESTQINNLANGIARLSQLTDKPLNAGFVVEQLTSAITGLHISYEQFLDNLNLLVERLGISNSTISRAMSFDPSHISRILTGQRRPGNLPLFISQLSDFVSRRIDSQGETERLAGLLNVPATQIEDPVERQEAIERWLATNNDEQNSSIGSFLVKLDSFDLNEYIKAIHFDEIKVPTVPFQLHTSKSFFGIKDMMEAEIDFLKATVLSKSMEDVINYSDMPLKEMADDEEFPKMWMMGIAMMLKKGLHLRMIHDVNRPFDEMMLGLEAWIPMYMTGQVHPYYLPQSQSGVFCHLLKTSGAAALVGEAISGYQKEGRYYLTKNREEVQHYQLRAKRLLEKARPLMHIYPDRNMNPELEKMLSAGSYAPEAFDNLEFSVNETSCVVTKTNEPKMHFVIEHPRLVHAIANFVAPIVE